MKIKTDPKDHNNPPTTNKLELFQRGFVQTLPYQTGVIPFGILYATLATSFGFPGWLIIFFSIVVFGGSSQLVFMDLVQRLSSPFYAVIGSNIVNARHMIYSAAVSSEFKKFSLRWKLLLAYLMTDQIYAFYQREQDSLDQIPQDGKPWFFFGSGICTWIFWILACCGGIIFGQIVPNSWNLGFSIPLMFMPLVFMMTKTRTDYLVVVTAAVLSVILHPLPYGLGVLFAILGASIAGHFIFAPRWPS